MIAQTINQTLRKVPAWPLYILAPIPVVWIYWLGITGELGVDPAKKIEHQLGLWALWGLIAGLAVTPLREKLGVNLIKYRRAIGVITFFYVFAHLLTWLVLDVQFQNVWADIVKRWYITVGMAGFAIMIPLALTSNNLAIRKMGPVIWRKLHKATYAVALLGALHFLLLVKGFQWEPILYTVAIVGLLAMRVNWSGLLASRKVAET
ncbi:protein-methionine-sulfoxide reductase heme-binding subunit MsrQ [Shimia ponticola]|uniref:protein-methionine-sulfoxide reductase heme-binding subunit MsrQ n=1 Tax=Shimia ponticola TaxID=2582893 RepID=UPI0011BEFED2|nr:protein-methionine-sulfoxide reductase heme-binding subunit MsrQ [Shimia ponticola]